jgi:putative transposase
MPEYTLFTTLTDAKEQIERWRMEYNESRPHRARGEIPPAEFARQWAYTPN